MPSHRSLLSKTTLCVTSTKRRVSQWKVESTYSACGETGRWYKGRNAFIKLVKIKDRLDGSSRSRSGVSQPSKMKSPESRSAHKMFFAKSPESPRSHDGDREQMYDDQNSNDERMRERIRDRSNLRSVIQ